MRLACQKLESLGWKTIDLNELRPNHPNSDLKIEKDGRIHYLQIKGKRQPNLKWMGVGTASGEDIRAGKLFNKAIGGMFCDFVVSVVMSDYEAGACRYFVFPVGECNDIFLRHARYTLAQPKKDGSPKSQGSCTLGTFIGPGTHRVSGIPDLTEEVLRYENAFHLL